MDREELDQMRAKAEAAKFDAFLKGTTDYARDIPRLLAEIERLQLALGARNTESGLIFLEEIEQRDREIQRLKLEHQESEEMHIRITRQAWSRGYRDKELELARNAAGDE